MLFTLMEIEGPLAKASNVFKGILKKKTVAATKVKEALHELETLIGHLESFGPKVMLMKAKHASAKQIVVNSFCLIAV